MKVRVRLFSIYRERAGVSQAELELPSGSKVAGVVAELVRRYPSIGLPKESGSVLYSVNREYAKIDDAVADGDEVAILPPVSGGADAENGFAKGVLLLSGGFDSPVAGAWALQNGKRLEAVHFTMEPFTDDASAHKARVLAGLLGLPWVTIIPLGEELSEFTKACEHRYYFVLLKRLMVRVAERVAKEADATFLVTGENLGQVSSQTLPNLGVIDQATRLPIVRPLLGYDKQEIITQAKLLGTYETSCGPEICDTLGPKHPSTAATLPKILGEERKLDVEDLVRRALAKAYRADATTTGALTVEASTDARPCP